MIKVKTFNGIGPDEHALERFLNEIGWKAVLNLSPYEAGRGNLGAIVVYEDGESAEQSGS